jgi:DNA-binding LytR/AlgR family response regulator
MAKWIGALLAAACMWLAAASAVAQPGVWLVPDRFEECSAEAGVLVPPASRSPDCHSTGLYKIDPQGRLIWIRAHLTPSDDFLASPGPWGVFVYAKASSTVFLNGEQIGSNGVPAATRADEIPGQMDFVVEAPRHLLHPGDNELLLLMSSQNGYVPLATPLHVLALGPYSTSTAIWMDHYWPSLIPLGLLIAGVFCFLVVGSTGDARTSSFLLAATSLFAAIQLLAEVSRGLVAYAYPLHDIRLMVVLLSSVGFGLSLSAHVIWTFAGRRRLLLLAGIASVTCLSLVPVSNLDSRAAVAIYVPMWACAALSAWWAYRRAPDALSYALALSASAALATFASSQFLDTYFFYLVAALVLFLFVQQATAVSRARRIAAVAEERSRQLELVLEQLRQKNAPKQLAIVSVGKIDRISVDRIECCNGADDYTELVLTDGTRILHNGTLADLERELPATFLRVHRSHIVNSAFVVQLDRETSGTGRLLLSSGMTVPVSRRTMPKVRDALKPASASVVLD